MVITTYTLSADYNAEPVCVAGVHRGEEHWTTTGTYALYALSSRKKGVCTTYVRKIEGAAPALVRHWDWRVCCIGANDDNIVQTSNAAWSVYPDGGQLYQTWNIDSVPDYAGMKKVVVTGQFTRKVATLQLEFTSPSA